VIGIKQNYVTKCLGRKVPLAERGWFPWPVNAEYTNIKSKFIWPDVVKNGTPPSRPSEIPLELTVYSVLNNASKQLNGNDCFKAYSDKFKTIKEGDTHRKSFKRLHRFRFSPTACYGHNEVHLHPWEARRLSVREAMRIQGIPDSYSLPEKAALSHKFAVVSNGVPVPLAYEVAQSLQRFFEKMKIASKE
jgi:DNA (cytosine-5)-methyltransferase 1